MKGHNRLSKIVLPSILLFSLASMNAIGAWETGADVEVFAQFSDNTRLDFTGEVEAVRSVERVDLSADYDSRNVQLALTGRAEFVQYSTDLLKDEENQRLKLSVKYSPRERINYGLYARHGREDYSSSQDSLQELVEGEPLPSTDIVGSREQYRIHRTLVRPSFSFVLSRRSSLVASYDYRRSEFDDNAGLADYDSGEASLSWSYRLSDARHDQIALQVGSVEYETARTEFTGVKANGIPIKLTYELPFGKRHYAAVSIGVNSISFENAGIEDESEFIYGLFVGNDDKESRHSYALSLNSNVRPDSSGRLIYSQALRGSYDYKVTRASRLGIKTLLFSNQQVGNVASGDDALFADRDYVAVEPNYAWDIGRRATFLLSYRYRLLRREDLDIDASDNMISATLKYELW